MERFALGVDPGKTGAAVLVRVRDGSPILTGESVSILNEASVEAVAWWYWRPSQSKAGGWLVDAWWGPLFAAGEGRRDRGNRWCMAAVGSAALADCRLAGARRFPIALEGLYNGKGAKLRGQRLVNLCEATGELMGALRGVAEGGIMRPTYSQWVSKVMPPAHGKPAKVAQRYIMANVHRVVAGLGEGWPDHVADAACMAYWAAVRSGQERRKG